MAKSFLIFCWTCVVLSAQTQLDLANQSKNADFSNFGFTRPIAVGTSLPATCQVGQFYFVSTATPGQNMFSCTATNTWNLAGGGLTDPGANGIVVRTGANATSVIAAPAGAVLGTTDAQTVTNKSIAASEINSGTLLNSVMPAPTLSALGGVQAINAVAHFVLTSIPTSGHPTASQLSFSDLLGSATAAQLPAFTGDATANSGTAALTLATVNSAPGTYGDSAHCATLTVDAKGRVTSASQSTSCPGGGGTGGFANPMTTLGDMIYENATPAPARIPGNTTTTPMVLSQTGTGTASAQPLWVTQYTLANGLGTSLSGSGSLQVNVTMSVRAVSGTNDTASNADCGGLITYNNSTNGTETLPQANLAGNFTEGCPLTFRNYGSGTFTIQSSGSSVGGATNVVVSANKGCLVVSHAGNYDLGNCN